MRINSFFFALCVAAAGLIPTVSGSEMVMPPTAKPYDETAEGSKQVAAAVKLAKQEGKHVLLQFGANWCKWCLKLHTLFKNDQAISQTLQTNYVLALIDVNEGHNVELVRQYEAEHGFGLPFLVVLNADGKRLITQNTAVLEAGDHHDPQKVLSFLKQWSPEAIRNKPASQWVEEFVALPEASFNSKCLEFKRIQELGAAAVPALVDVIRHQSSGRTSEAESLRRTRACWALGALGPSARSAVPFLAEQFRANQDLRQTIANTLAGLGPQAEAAVPVLSDAFSSPDPHLQSDAGLALIHVAPSYPGLLPELTRWLSSSNVYCRRVAPKLLEALGPAAKAALPSLRKATQDEDETVRKNATKALERVGDSSNPTEK